MAWGPEIRAVVCYVQDRGAACDTAALGRIATVVCRCESFVVQQVQDMRCCLPSGFHHRGMGKGRKGGTVQGQNDPA